jgi:transposase
MPKPLLSDALWQRLEPLLPSPKPRRARFPGRKALGCRKVLTGILFVLKTGIPWKDLPHEMGCGSGMSCLNYLRAWQDAGVWEQLQAVLRAELPEGHRIDWSRAALRSDRPLTLRGEEGGRPVFRTEAG